MSDRPPYFAIALLSGATLGYEILLMRLFSIIQWHHFSYMMISTALLGYGASGTLVSLLADKVHSRFAQVFVTSAVAFGVSSVGCFLCAQETGFNPLAILWEPTQALRLLLIYLLLFVPFLCAATCICATFVRYPSDVHRVYGFDIVGAGLGSLAVIALLFALFPVEALKFIGALGLIAAAVAAIECGLRSRSLLAPLLTLGAIVFFAMPAEWTELRLSEYKALSQTLRVMGTRVIAERSSPLGLITVVESPAIPFRHAPGLSLNASQEPPPQLAIFTDGEGPSALNRFSGKLRDISYLDYLTSALPYHLLEGPAVLVLGAGAGADVLQALHAGATKIDAVELNPQIVELVQKQYAAFSGPPYSARGVDIHIGEARGYVAGSDARYDLIQIALLDSFGASAAGLHALSESYLYTVEAFEIYLDHLAPGGMLSITRWASPPPREVLKLFATAISALEKSGVRDPAARLALIRGWKTGTLIVKNGPLENQDIARLKEFCRLRSFDLVYYPGIGAAEANRYNVLAEPYFFEGARALLGPERGRYLDRYKFDIRPASDDRPYFFHFFKWRSAPEFLALQRSGGLPLLEWGYPLLIATVLQALVASFVFIMLPLAIARRRTAARACRWKIALYFLALGFAFIFIEIAFIQKFLLFLSHPLYAVTIVLAAFLVFAGLGSRFSGKLRAEKGVWWPVSAIAGLALIYIILLQPLFAPLVGLPDAARIAVSAGLIAPLAFAMGMPFPMGLSRVALAHPPLLPWAWALNGCASVVGAALATLTAIHFGFNLLVAIAVALYFAAAACFPAATPGESGGMNRVGNKKPRDFAGFFSNAAESD